MGCLLLQMPLLAIPLPDCLSSLPAGHVSPFPGEVLGSLARVPSDSTPSRAVTAVWCSWCISRVIASDPSSQGSRELRPRDPWEGPGSPERGKPPSPSRVAFNESFCSVTTLSCSPLPLPPGPFLPSCNCPSPSHPSAFPPDGYLAGLGPEIYRESRAVPLALRDSGFVTG